jgi:hypothetical protein
MPLSHSDALAVARLSDRLQSACKFRLHGFHIRMTTVQSLGKFYVGVYGGALILPDGETVRAGCHLTVYNSSQCTEFLSLDQQGQLRERLAEAVAQEDFVMTGVVPLHNSNDDPHRMLLHCHVGSPLAIRLERFTRWVRQITDGSENRRGASFHLSLDKVEVDMSFPPPPSMQVKSSPPPVDMSFPPPPSMQDLIDRLAASLGPPLATSPKLQDLLERMTAPLQTPTPPKPPTPLTRGLTASLQPPPPPDGWKGPWHLPASLHPAPPPDGRKGPWHPPASLHPAPPPDGWKGPWCPPAVLQPPPPPDGWKGPWQLTASLQPPPDVAAGPRMPLQPPPDVAAGQRMPWQPWMAGPPPPPALAAGPQPWAKLWPLQLQQPSLTASLQLPLKSPSGDPRPARHRGSSFPECLDSGACKSDV